MTLAAGDEGGDMPGGGGSSPAAAPADCMAAVAAPDHCFPCLWGVGDDNVPYGQPSEEATAWLEVLIICVWLPPPPIPAAMASCHL